MRDFLARGLERRLRIPRHAVVNVGICRLGAVLAYGLLLQLPLALRHMLRMELRPRPILRLVGGGRTALVRRAIEALCMGRLEDARQLVEQICRRAEPGSIRVQGESAQPPPEREDP